MGILERIGQGFGNELLAVLQAEVLGNVAGLVAVHERQAWRSLDRRQLDDQALQVRLLANVASQHQLDEGVLRQAGVERGEEFGAWVGGGFHKCFQLKELILSIKKLKDLRLTTAFFENKPCDDPTRVLHIKGQWIVGYNRGT
jgi:hypothetical protein